MTLRIGPPGWQTQYDGGEEVGAYFNAMADVIGAAPYNPYGGYRPPMPQSMYRPQFPPQYMPPPPPNYSAYGPGIPSQRINPTIPGAPAIGVKLQPLGFGTTSFTSTSGTALTATTRPQKPFKGRRLVVDIARSGATSTGLVSITAITVGVNNQLASTGAVGAGAFAAGAFDCNVELSACSSALDISVNYSISLAPSMTDTVVIGTTLFGETVGS